MRHIFRPVADATAATVTDHWGSLNWLANAALTGSTMTVGRTIIHPGKCNPRHKHPNCDEVLYLLAGRLDHSVGDEHVEMRAGDTIVIPKGVFHNAVNIGDVDADMIVVFSSGERDFVPENAGESE